MASNWVDIDLTHLSLTWSEPRGQVIVVAWSWNHLHAGGLR